MSGILKKLVEPAVENATDFLKSFSDKTFYHGTSAEITEFKPNINKNWFGKGKGMNLFKEEEHGRTPATFFTTSKGYAEGFAENRASRDKTDPKIYEVKLKTKNVFDYRNPDDVKKLKDSLGLEENSGLMSILKTGEPYYYQTDFISNKLKELGYRGYHTNEVSQLGEETIGLFYPDEGDVRSISAKFDPKESESGNIMAAVPVAASVGALSALPEETRR